MNDLLYTADRSDYDKLMSDMKRKWPEAVFADASDFIHPYRFSIDNIPLSEEEYLLCTLVNGFFNCSFAWQYFELGQHDKALAMLRAVCEYKGIK